jgi:hypothetical protein
MPLMLLMTMTCVGGERVWSGCFSAVAKNEPIMARCAAPLKPLP